jgi:electron transfer flavoprotein-quinone oxidoreductase
VAKVIEGGRLVEYSAHLIPIAGINMMPKLYSDGFLVAGDAAAFVVGTGLVLEGANFAVASAIAAAETVIKAKEKGDYSADFLSYYHELLKRSFVLKDLETFKKAPHFLENPRMYTTYPELACNLMEKIFTNDGQPRKKTWQLIKDTMKDKKVSLVQMARDLFTARGATILNKLSVNQFVIIKTYTSSNEDTCKVVPTIAAFILPGRMFYLMKPFNFSYEGV